MTTATYLVGDVFDRLAEIPDGTIDLVMTSPPFYRLRSYLPDDHPDKGKEIGSEPTPAEYLDTMLALTAEWGRVLAPHGSICVELGDTYAGSGGAGGDYNEDGLRDGQQRFNGSARAHADVPPDKSLLFIPSLYAGSLAYGRNLLTGAESPAGRWRVRNLVAWVRPNPPVGALGDKFRPATSYLTIACRARDRYFDLDSVRSGTADTAGTASRAVPSIADSHVVPTTLHADSLLAPRGWCDPGQSKVAIGSTVAWQTKRLQVVEPVRFLVGVEQVEGPTVMNLQPAGRPADLALVPITVERFLSGTVPVASPVGRSASVPTGVVLASEVDAPPLTGTFESAKVVSQDLALVADQWLAARITLHLDGACRTAFAVAPITGTTHSEESSSKYPTSGNGAPPLDWWNIPPSGYPGAHYAVYPPELCTRPILTMTPRKVCTTCGKPSRRLVQADRHMPLGRSAPSDAAQHEHGHRLGWDSRTTGTGTTYTTVGWSDCGHGTWRPGHVLDPFAGTGTTLAVATGHARQATGIDIDPRNAQLALERVGMFLTIDHGTRQETA